MEIYCIGTDIIDTSRVERAIKSSSKFKDRVYTKAEQIYCDSKKAQRSESYAARYAAKEAIAKSLKSGFGQDLSLKEIEIISMPGRPPRVRFYGKSKAYKESLGIKEIKVSISAVRDYALAYAVSLI